MTDHYFSQKPKSELKIEKIKIPFNGVDLTFKTGSGVFSVGKFDKGTDILIHNMQIKNDTKILDLGCGWGVVGIYIKRFYSDCEVWMSDINERALSLTRDNCKLNNVECQIKKSFLYTKLPDGFDTIIANPPTHAGKELCFQLIQDAKAYLKKGGTLQIVARHQKGGKALEKKMQETFGNVEALAKKIRISSLLFCK